LTLAAHRRAPLRPSRGLPRWLPPPARGLLRRLLGSPAASLQRAPPRGWCFPRLRPLSTEDIRISFPRRPRLLLEDDCVLTFYNAGLWQRSLHGRRLGLCLGAGADSSAAGAESSSATAVLGSSSS
jgi:hypothetical protein